MRNVAVSLLAVGMLLSGCAGKQGDGGDQPIMPDSQYQDDAVNVTVPTMPRLPPLPGERTLDAAPEWRLGEWWKYRLTDNFTGDTYEFMRIVAGEDRSAGNYLVGFPVDDFKNDIMIFHIPGYGDIRQADLAYETHDAYFQPLQFPLKHGASWEMDFEGVSPGTATVGVQEDGTARIELTTQSYDMVAIYDPELGEISSLDIPNYAQYEIIEHGFDYQGVVRVPHAHDLVFIHARTAGVVTAGLAPQSPIDTVVLDPGYDRVSFTIILGGDQFLGVPPEVTVAAGYFAEKVTAPDGTVFESKLLPHEGGLKVTFYGHDKVAGTWTMEHTAAGVGVAFVEGIAYHSIDVDLPSGCVIQSQNAQHHNADCKVDQPAS